MFYRSGNENWSVVKDGAYTNLLNFNIYYSNDIEVYEDFTISTGTTITRGEAFTVSTDILNDGESDFSGDFALDLYDMEGSFATTVETLSGGPLEPGFFYDDVEFSSEGVNVEPGSYLMAMTHKSEGGNWILSGSSYATNPIKIIIKQAPLSPDMYEENDTEENPHVLTPVFSDDVASLNTEGSNSHIGTDVDFYKLMLETGYDYTVSARIHDSYNSGNQEIYTNDIVWTYYANGAWSDLFDDVLPGDILIPDGGEMIFGIAPYYEGETGTYLLELGISRTEALSTNPAEDNTLMIYPNPVSRKLNIEASATITGLEIFDTNGRLMEIIPVNSKNKIVNFKEFSEGAYYLRVTQEEKISIQKIIKQ